MQGGGATSQAADQRALLPLLRNLLRVPSPLLRWSSCNCVIYCASCIVCRRSPISVRNEMPRHTHLSSRSPGVQESSLPRDVCLGIFPSFSLSFPLTLRLSLSPVVRGFVPRPSSPATRREASQSDAVPLRAPRAPFHVPPRQPFHSPFHTERRAEKGRKSREEREKSETPFEDEGGLEGKERHRRGGTRSEKTGNSSVGRWFPMTSRRQVTSLEGVRRPSRGQAARCWRRGLMRRLRRSGC